MKISAVIITLNEERNIGRCIESLQGIVDEIVVVDSLSTDKTEEICKAAGVHFIQQKWLGYGLQKNYANSLAKNDMILSIDADEALSNELKASILELKEQPEVNNAAYCMNRLTNYCGQWIRHSCWFPDIKIRIFNRKMAYWSDQQVHEELRFSSPIKIVRLNGLLLHYSYYAKEEMLAQSEKFSKLAAEECFKKGKKVGPIMQILKTFWAFCSNYFIKLGILDGKNGFTISCVAAATTYKRYNHLRKLYKERASAK
jgi:(heptosyl)LPS beta-1,4-glucosyltransferase